MVLGLWYSVRNGATLMTIDKKTYEEIYKMLDAVDPVDFDCGTLCGGLCCTCSYEPEEEFRMESDENADSYMGLYLLPGEEAIYNMDPDAPDNDCGWIDWGYLVAEDYEFPESWHGKVSFIQCKTSPHCKREKRPIQCRTFPLAPHIDENGVFSMILNQDDLPYECPLIAQNSLLGGEITLNEAFIETTYIAWQKLLQDPLILDLVELDSETRIEEGWDIVTVL